MTRHDESFRNWPAPATARCPGQSPWAGAEPGPDVRLAGRSQCMKRPHRDAPSTEPRAAISAKPVPRDHQHRANKPGGAAARPRVKRSPGRERMRAVAGSLLSRRREQRVKRLLKRNQRRPPSGASRKRFTADHGRNPETAQTSTGPWRRSRRRRCDGNCRELGFLRIDRRAPPCRLAGVVRARRLPFRRSRTAPHE